MVILLCKIQTTRASAGKISQPSSSQRVSAAWQNATERFTR